MTVFASSAFGGTTGQELSVFDSAFSKVTGNTGDAIITAAARLRASSTTGVAYLHSGTPASPDYEVTVDWFYANSAGAPSAGAIGRCSTSANTYYNARVAEISSVPVLQLVKMVAGVQTQLGSNVAITAAAGNTYQIKLKMVGSTIEAYFNGAASPDISVTDTAITAAGKAGVRFGNTSTPNDAATYHLDNFSADDGVGGGGGDVYTFITPKDGKIAQLSGGSTGTATITATGSYTGTAPNQARLVNYVGGAAVSGFDWATIGSATGGVFSHTFSSVPKGGWYAVEVRNSGTLVDEQSGRVGAGVLVAVDGQSNAWLWFSDTAYAGDGLVTPEDRLRLTGIQTAGEWTIPTSNMDAASACGNWLIATLNCPVGLIDGSDNGSALIGDWTSGGSVSAAYTASANAVDDAGGAAATIWIQGEADAGSSVTQSAYYTALGVLFAARRSDLSDAGHPYILATLARNTSGAHTDAQREEIKKAQVQKCGDTEVYRVDRQDLSMHSDGVHHDAAGFVDLGERCAQAVLAALGEATYYRGPQIASVAKVNSTTFDVNLTLSSPATDISPASGITGFRVLDGGTPVTISAAVRQSATQVRLTLSAATAGVVTVQYLYGAQPAVIAVLRDDSSLALPLEFNAGVNALLPALRLRADGTFGAGAPGGGDLPVYLHAGHLFAASSPAAGQRPVYLNATGAFEAGPPA
jgi:hypothetical protein